LFSLKGKKWASEISKDITAKIKTKFLNLLCESSELRMINGNKIRMKSNLFSKAATETRIPNTVDIKTFKESINLQ
jgi:transcriptional regulator of met regulon